MERLRWLDRNPPRHADRREHRAATFSTIGGTAQLRDKRNVVVGQPDRETPQLQAPIVKLVAHPYWRVPKSIARPRNSATKSPALARARTISRWRTARCVAAVRARRIRSGSSSSTCETTKRSTCTTRRPRPCSACPSGTAAMAASGSRTRVGFAMCSPPRRRASTTSRKAMQGPRREGYVKLKKGIPVRLMYRTAFLVRRASGSSRRLRLGRRCRLRARPTCRPADAAQRRRGQSSVN